MAAAALRAEQIFVLLILNFPLSPGLKREDLWGTLVNQFSQSLRCAEFQRNLIGWSWWWPNRTALGCLPLPGSERSGDSETSGNLASMCISGIGKSSLLFCRWSSVHSKLHIWWGACAHSFCHIAHLFSQWGVRYGWNIYFPDLSALLTHSWKCQAKSTGMHALLAWSSVGWRLSLTVGNINKIYSCPILRIHAILTCDFRFFFSLFSVCSLYSPISDISYPHQMVDTNLQQLSLVAGLVLGAWVWNVFLKNIVLSVTSTCFKHKTHKNALCPSVLTHLEFVLLAWQRSSKGNKALNWQDLNKTFL